jgi:hypothetical protein
MNCSNLKVGDKIIRNMGGVKMPMRIKQITDKVIICSAIQPNGGEFNGGWQFDIRTGAEEDEDLKWGVEYGATGSVIESKVEE